jgi:hypothetical protein
MFLIDHFNVVASFQSVDYSSDHEERPQKNVITDGWSFSGVLPITVVLRHDGERDATTRGPSRAGCPLGSRFSENGQ